METHGNVMSKIDLFFVDNAAEMEDLRGCFGDMGSMGDVTPEWLNNGILNFVSKVEAKKLKLIAQYEHTAFWMLSKPLRELVGFISGNAVRSALLERLRNPFLLRGIWNKLRKSLGKRG